MILSVAIDIGIMYNYSINIGGYIMAKIIGPAIPNIPWQDKPEGYKYPVWRYDGNTVITRDNLYGANSIFNSAVVPYGDGFAGVFRVDNLSRDHTLVVGYSKDAINWELEEKVIFRGYDPRLCEIEGKYYLSWVNLTPHGTTIGIAYTTDFKEWTQLEDACYPVARNGVLFPRKVNDEYLLLIRPCDRGHTPYGDIYLSHSKDLTYWGKHRFVMSPVKNWEMTKVGAGPTPIELEDGWLMFYHGVLTSCNGFTYAMGVAILDCAALADSESGKIAIYYGAADTSVALAFTTVDEVVEFIKEHDLNK